MVLKDNNINQTMLIDLQNSIPEDYPYYFIKNVVDLIDCSEARHEFRGKPGEFAYPQELLLKLILMSVFIIKRNRKKNKNRNCIYVSRSNEKTIIQDNRTI